MFDKMQPAFSKYAGFFFIILGIWKIYESLLILYENEKYGGSQTFSELYIIALLIIIALVSAYFITAFALIRNAWWSYIGLIITSAIGCFHGFLSTGTISLKTQFLPILCMTFAVVLIINLQNKN
jgi:hypothetical protein